MFGSRAGFTFGYPKTVNELRSWAEDGLIPDFSGATMIDDVISSMLQAVRKHLNECNADQQHSRSNT